MTIPSPDLHLYTSHTRYLHQLEHPVQTTYPKYVKFTTKYPRKLWYLSSTERGGRDTRASNPSPVRGLSTRSDFAIYKFEIQELIYAFFRLFNLIIYA